MRATSKNHDSSCPDMFDQGITRVAKEFARNKWTPCRFTVTHNCSSFECVCAPPFSLFRRWRTGKLEIYSWNYHSVLICTQKLHIAICRQAYVCSLPRFSFPRRIFGLIDFLSPQVFPLFNVLCPTKDWTLGQLPAVQPREGGTP